jgi:hypothetical protein
VNKLRKIGLLLLVVLFIATAVGYFARAQEGAEQANGDFNDNGRVDSDDLFDFAYFYGYGEGDPEFDAEGAPADMDGNGRVDEMDLFFFTAAWQEDHR